MTSDRATSVTPTRRVLAALARAAAPGFGCCYRCGMPWKFTEPHITDYSASHGCFPLCEACWAVLTPEQRVPFYEYLIHDWVAESDVEGGEAEAIIGAVMRGG